MKAASAPLLQALLAAALARSVEASNSTNSTGDGSDDDSGDSTTLIVVLIIVAVVIIALVAAWFLVPAKYNPLKMTKTPPATRRESGQTSKVGSPANLLPMMPSVALPRDDEEL